MEDITNNATALTTFKQNFPSITKNANQKGQIWISCVDAECFKKQGGTYDPNAKPAFSKAKSIETRLSQVESLRDKVWLDAVQDAMKLVPEFVPNNKLLDSENVSLKEKRDEKFRDTFLKLFNTYAIGFSA